MGSIKYYMSRRLQTIVKIEVTKYEQVIELGDYKSSIRKGIYDVRIMMSLEANKIWSICNRKLWKRKISETAIRWLIEHRKHQRLPVFLGGGLNYELIINSTWRFIRFFCITHRLIHINMGKKITSSLAISRIRNTI